MDLKKERRQRYLESLIKEAIINVLAEQEQQAPAAPVAPTAAEQPEAPVPAVEPEPAVAEAPAYTVDDMIQELNAIRGGRSLSDPEVYGRLVTFFKGLSDQQRNLLDTLLTQIAELITGVEPAEKQKEQQLQHQTQGAAQPPPPKEAPQKAAPMPGAQAAPAGEADLGLS